MLLDDCWQCFGWKYLWNSHHGNIVKYVTFSCQVRNILWSNYASSLCYRFWNWGQFRVTLICNGATIMVVFTDLPSWNLSIDPNSGMDPRRTLLVIIMNRIIQPECCSTHFIRGLPPRPGRLSFRRPRRKILVEKLSTRSQNSGWKLTEVTGNR